MHIPDGFLDGKSIIATGGLAAGGVSIALWHAHRHLPRRRVPLMGLAAAFIFAAQMINFPIGAGTSGHLIGGTLAAVLLGPSAAVVVLTAVLIIQCFLFADGGVTALGANILCMGIVDAVIGYAIYRVVHQVLRGKRGQLAAVGFAAWCSTVLAALVCALLLVASHRGEAHVLVPAMVGVHMLIGLGEAAITMLAISALMGARADLIARPKGSTRAAMWETALYGLLVAIGLAVFVAPFASTSPDGLESVAHKQGFESSAAPAPLLPAPLPDYAVRGIKITGLSTAIAGMVGTLVVFGLAVALAKVLVPARPPSLASAAGDA